MSTVNTSTGFSPFQLHIGRNLRLIPPLFSAKATALADDLGAPAVEAAKLIEQIELDSLEACDNLLLAKTQQAEQANKHHLQEDVYSVGDLVMLSTFNREREYLQCNNKRVGKFLVRYDGPYHILRAFPESSVYTLDLPESMRIFPTFHASLLKRYMSNDPTLFPSRQLPQPGPIVGIDGDVEWEVESLMDKRKRGRGHQYLVRWHGWGPGADFWIPASVAEELAAFNTWLIKHPEDVQNSLKSGRV